MYLLSAEQIRLAIAEPRSDGLGIDNFEPNCLQHTSYYFRLGSGFFKGHPGTADSFIDQFGELSEMEPFLRFRPREYIRIESYEGFRMGATTLGIFGAVSDTAKLGLQMVNSPFIDPMFPGGHQFGRLELGLVNLTDYEASLRYKSVIGKVSFFDVSETSPIDLIPGSASETKFKQRSKRR